MSVEAFAADGYTILEAVFKQSDIDEAFAASLLNVSQALNIIKSNNLEFGVGIKYGFKEIVQRHTNRYEMPYQMNSDVFDFVLNNSVIQKLVSDILQCEDYVVANRSLVISQPGCTDQSWHSDGPHYSFQEHLPCHVLNVFVPLVDIDQSNGPTEFRPGSHYYTRGNLASALLLARARKTLRPVETPFLKKGSALLFDYRVLHRGTANTSNEVRPILVFTFAKPWYKDNLNFPHRSLFDHPLSKSTDEKNNNEI